MPKANAKNTNSRSTKRGKSTDPIKPQTKPETATPERAMSAVEKRRARLEAKRDGAGAFHVASLMENDIMRVKMCTDALFVIAEGVQDDNRMSGVIYSMAYSLESVADQIGEKQHKICRATWAFAYGAEKRKEADQSGSPPSLQQIANLEKLISGWKREAKKVASKTATAKAA